MSEISVVVPTYNRAKLIAATLDAILAQTRPADEVIVVDDGSTDDTQAVLARYAGAAMSIRNVNSGELVTRNLGLRAATGRLVAFCDSDDLWLPEFLATMSDAWRHAPTLVAAYSDFRALENGRLSPGTKFADAPADFWEALRDAADGLGVFDAPFVRQLLRFQPFFPSCMMVDRAAFLALGGWDEGVSRIVGCDSATTMRVAAAPPVGVVRHALVAIRKHPGNFSGNTEAMHLGDALVLEYVLRNRPELSELAAAIRDSIVERRQKALASAFVRRDFQAVRDIDRLLDGRPRPVRHRVKVAIAGLPEPLGRALAAVLS
jgi:glycosyltransferase involved in cell wall biosynthesis